MNIHHQSIDSPFYSTFGHHSDVLDKKPDPSVPFTPAAQLDCNLFSPEHLNPDSPGPSCSDSPEQPIADD